MKKLLMVLIVFAVACGDDSQTSSPENTNNLNNVQNNENNVNNLPERASEICQYTNPFSRSPECREYESVWSGEQIATDCESQSGELSTGTCTLEELLGNCFIPVEGIGTTILFAYGDPGTCGTQKFGCETFAKGTFEPAPTCEEDAQNNSNNVTPVDNVFQPPELICRSPMPGEPAGEAQGGEVCTWQAISGATEPGRRFEDYASCDVVRTQRPYYPLGRPADAEKEDPRMHDPEYVTELNWVKEQIDATACVCCHKASVTPDGPSNWYIDQPGNFMNGFFDSGLALGANWVNSVAFGAFSPEANNGFNRTDSGFPTTDPERMVAFFQAELEYRGLTEADFADTPPFGGPLYDQIYYEPQACGSESGIAADGTITWAGGDARYVVVLEEGSLNPTVPPNLDEPEGTIWKIDVSPDEPAIESGSVKFGEVPDSALQAFPAAGTPAELEAGKTYFLHVSADVGIPVTRCLTTVQ